MFKKRRQTVEEKAIEAIQAELSKYPSTLARDLAEYQERLRRKREAAGALEQAEAEAQRLDSERIELKKRFWEAHYEQNEGALSKLGRRYGPLERAAKKAERRLQKARVSFEKADFDEVAESFALKAKANIAEGEVNRRTGELEHALEDLLLVVRRETEEAGQALRGEYEEPSFETAEERDAHVQKTIAILTAVAESYTPGE